MQQILTIVTVLILVIPGTSPADDWSQWRGARRDGVDHQSPPLINALPPEGLSPLWVSEPVRSQKDGGFGSPVVVGDRVYLFAHVREKLKDLGPTKYPYLSPEKRTGMSDAEFAEYEQNRRDEQQEQAKAFAFREKVLCLDRDTGKTVWTNSQESVYSRWPQSGSPAIVDGRLYILGGGRTVRCIDALTGESLWETPLPGEFRDEYYQASPVVAEGVVVVMLDHLFGVAASDGMIAWEGDPQLTKGSHSSPVVWKKGDRHFVLANVSGSQTACVDPTDGRILWREQTEGGQATPVVVGDRLVTYGRSRKSGLRCFALSEDGAEQLWAFQRVQDKGSSPVVVDGYVYVQGDREVACVDLETGKSAWQTTLKLGSPQYSSLIAADGKVFYAYESLTAFAASPKEFVMLINARFNDDGLMASEETFRRMLDLNEIEKQPDGLEKSQRLMQKETGRQGPLRTTSPAIADGRLYVRTKDALACYDLRVKSQ